MDHDHVAPDGAERELGAIHAGGKHLLIVIRQQVSKALDKLDDGDFSGTMDHLTTAAHMVGSLASAKQYIAVADGARLVNGHGSMTTSVIAPTLDSSCPTSRSTAPCKHHISVKIGEHEMRFSGDQEVYVVA